MTTVGAVLLCGARSHSWESDLAAVPATPGIYRICNVVNGKSYVGSSVNIRRRWSCHLRYLTRGSGSGQPILKSAWAKYGAEAFEFCVVEWVADTSTLLAREQSWIEAIDSVKNGYNVRVTAASNLGIRYGPAPAERGRKISAARIGKYRGRPSPMKGLKHRPESCVRMSATKRTRPESKIALGDEALCLSDWADRIGITVRALGNRIRRGWPLDRALTEASRGY